MHIRVKIDNVYVDIYQLYIQDILFIVHSI